MAPEIHEERKKLDEIEKRFERLVDRFTEALHKQPAPGNQSTITLNAGGFGVWLATTCCFVMLAINVALVSIVVSHNRKIDDLQHYLHAIYMMAPELKPKEK